MTRDPHIYHRGERAFRLMLAGRYDTNNPCDLISDLMHYAASHGLDPFDEVESAANHYRAEVHDTGDGTNEDGDTIEYPDPAHECGGYCPREVAA